MKKIINNTFPVSGLRSWILNLFRISNFEFRISRFAGGFTIIEALVAIAILLLSITTPLTIAEKGLAAAEASRHEITAFYLAQEAIEYVRNARDANAIAREGGGPNWLQGLNQCMSADGCGIDVTAPPGQQIIRCMPPTDDCVLSEYTGPVSELQGLFGHRTGEGWQRTDFIRNVTLEELQNGIEAKITATVTWRAGSLGSRTMSVSENILNWYVSED